MRGTTISVVTFGTCAVMGLDGYIVEVEVDIAPGPSAFKIVGARVRHRAIFGAC
ncbi:MAG: hypothetical protein IIB17_01610 [Chloroflexi bacterium]|nr:hypothetical protein [Chloroflexota bacterium]